MPRRNTHKYVLQIFLTSCDCWKNLDYSFSFSQDTDNSSHSLLFWIVWHLRLQNGMLKELRFHLIRLKTLREVKTGPDAHFSRANAPRWPTELRHQVIDLKYQDRIWSELFTWLNMGSDRLPVREAEGIQIVTLQESQIYMHSPKYTQK